MSKELEALQEIRKYSGKTIVKSVWSDNNGYSKTITINDLCDIIETALKRIDYLERVNKNLQESKDKLIEERNNKIIEHRIVYDGYNFQSIKKFVACKSCQYYENEKCMNKDDCFWLDLERKLKALEIIKEKDVQIGLLKGILHADESLHTASYYNSYFSATYRHLTQEEFDLLREVLL